MTFKIHAEDGLARVGTLIVPSGKKLETPFFMPVMTKGAVKNMSPDQLMETKTQCCIANSFILSLKPGTQFLKDTGGIHEFSQWKGGIFTDSGGFQMLSKSLFKDITNEYVVFKNPFSGKDQKLTPEESMKNQLDIGSDVAMALDHVPSYYNMTREKMIECCNRTQYWAHRCKIAHEELQKSKKKQLLFGISQGGVYQDLRAESAKRISKVGFDGLAFGGFCFGESDTEMYSGIEASKREIPKNIPIYIMGMGHPIQILESISLGCDIFDSTFPTMSARHGTIFTRKGNIRILKSEFRYDTRPLEENCNCYACTKYSRAFIHQLLEMKENFGKTLATIHNIYFIQSLIEDARKAIKNKTFATFKKEISAHFQKNNENIFKYT
jgi:queuine tRNA-ribosyltransferase